MKNLFVALFLIFFLGCSKEKSNLRFDDSSVDSLKLYLDLAKDMKISKEKRFEFTQKASAVVDKLPNDSISRKYLFWVANRFYNNDYLTNYENTVLKLIQQSKEAKDTLFLARGYSYLGDYYVTKLQHDSAYTYYFKAEKLLLNDKHSYNLGRVRFNKATLQYEQSDYLGAEIAAFRALSAVKGRSSGDLIFDCYNLLGVLYNDLGEYDKAIEYTAKAFAIIDDEINVRATVSRAMSLNNMGLVYQSMKNHTKAVGYFEKGLLQKNLLIDDPSIYAMLSDNLAYSKFKLNQFDQLPDLFFKSLKIRNDLGEEIGIIVNEIHLSEYYARLKDTTNALAYAEKALRTAENSSYSRYQLAPLKQLAILQPDKAATLTSEYLHINDSLQRAERSMGNKFTRIEYETDKIKGEVTELEDKNRNLIYLFSFFAILSLFFYVIKIQRAKHRELLLKQAQQQANEEIYNLIINQQSHIDAHRVIEKTRVAKELHDGVLGRMFGVRMNLEGLNSFQDELAVTQRKEYIVELKKIEQDIREISHEMNREKSELINNFVAIVNNLFEEQRRTFQTKLITTIDQSINWDLASNIVKINLYRIIQESLQNCNKYANAKIIKVELKKVDGDVQLILTDDGEGFNMKVLKKGIGLQNMISRAKECQGNLTVLSNIGEGTTITLIIPLEQKQIPA